MLERLVCVIGGLILELDHLPVQLVESHDADMYAAIDLVIDKLDRQVIKFKNKTANHAHEALKHKVVE